MEIKRRNLPVKAEKDKQCFKPGPSLASFHCLWLGGLPVGLVLLIFLLLLGSGCWGWVGLGGVGEFGVRAFVGLGLVVGLWVRVGGWIWDWIGVGWGWVGLGGVGLGLWLGLGVVGLGLEVWGLGFGVGAGFWELDWGLGGTGWGSWRKPAGLWAGCSR